VPDWPKFVKDRLGSLGLDPRREAEIVSELADHHADLFEEARHHGFPEMEAEARVAGQVSDWRDFRREIRRAKREEILMNRRNRTLWLPGLITSILFIGLLRILAMHMIVVRDAWLNRPAFGFNLPWILALPIVGGLGAFVSRRLAGNRRESLLAGLFPAAVMCVVFVALFPLILLSDTYLPKTFLLHAYVGAFLADAIIPGVALLAGTLPFTLVRRQEPTASGRHP